MTCPALLAVCFDPLPQGGGVSARPQKRAQEFRQTCSKQSLLHCCSRFRCDAESPVANVFVELPFRREQSITCVYIGVISGQVAFRGSEFVNFGL
ncbi:hypothetical protein HPB52_024365 [Rhipicephalus sanguineus]|uniref:Uncharacterized protein n=1 Tax=Rhipicephalus sanguineus TaxID=34632 RepID=A0A9D4PAM4_RHISA|nr:hypothetical protein HPB52_024365 [Rhipicephalus sanguineus]